MPNDPSRRSFLRAAALAASGLYAGVAPSFVRADRPSVVGGVASGDITNDRAIVWSRGDRPSRMVVEYALDEGFGNAGQRVGPVVTEAGDFTGRVDLYGLPPGVDVHYRVFFEDLAERRAVSEPVTGRLRTAPDARRDIRFQWSADTCGQGWGINEDAGGMTIYETMRRAAPDFFVHCGDTIYADNPLEARRPLPDGTVWKNLVTEAKSKVAETLDEFRGNFAYNLMDANVRAFNGEVPLIMQWDDHEVVDNWYPAKVLDDERYRVKDVALLASRARQAFLEYNPVRIHPADGERIYRVIPYGPSLDVFVVDMRSYRGHNLRNDQAAGSDGGTALLGRRQAEWLKRALSASRATWKVIAAAQPLGLVIPDDWRAETGADNAANGDGPPRGRELEIADILGHIRRENIDNVVWLTADVHYTAAHHYHPDRGRFQDFKPFWEFVAGPLNAGTFGPKPLDDTFGPRVEFRKTPPEGELNLPPSAGLQFYGEVAISGADEVMTVDLKDASGATLYRRQLEPA